MTIRLRLTLLYSSLLIAMLALFGMAVFGILDQTLRSQTDDNLVDTLDDTEQILLANRAADGHLQPTYFGLKSFQPIDSMYVQLWLHNEQELINLSRSLEGYGEHLDANSVGHTQIVFSNVEIDGINLRVATRPMVIDGHTMGYLQVASSLESIQHATYNLAIIMGILGAIAVMLSLFLGSWMASRALAPINSINNTAQQIVAADDLKRRVPYNSSDELGALTATINRMLERLERLFTSQQQFVSDVSHELRTPLAAIQGHSEIIQRFGYEEESMTAIARSTERMVHLVEDLMFLANADIGRLNPVKADVELDTVLLEAYNHAKTLSKDRVVVQIQHLDHVMVKADPYLLKNLLKHLITNAVTYTNDQGHVMLSLRQHGQWVDLSVTDTGIGIAPEDLSHVFDRFYRADKARSRISGGSGLGLSIAMWIAKAHDGDLLVESTLGKGTTFTLRLPYLS